MDDIKTPSAESDSSNNNAKIQTAALPNPSPFASSPVPHTSKPLKTYRIWRWHLSQRQLIALIGGSVTGLLLVLIGGFIWYTHSHKKPAPTAPAVVKPITPPPAPKPTTVPSRLTGVQIAPALDQRSITGVMIENSPDARPQSGLQDAGVVFEAIAEGGITRFLALYEEGQPANIGPVRSARPYYLEWLMPFDAALAHAGGSPDALNAIRSLGVKDLDEFANGSYYHRVSTRYAPHNLYTSTANLDALKQKKGYTVSTFTGFPRKLVEQPAKQPVITKIDLNMSGFYYNVHYAYDPATNTYKRSEGGQPHIDGNSGQQLSPKVVIAMVVPYSLASDRVHSIYNTTGSGQAYIFQDGIEIQATWSKADTKSQIQFKDQSGQPVKLDPGQTWITAVAASNNVALAH